MYLFIETLSGSVTTEKSDSFPSQRAPRTLVLMHRWGRGEGCGSEGRKNFFSGLGKLQGLSFPYSLMNSIKNIEHAFWIHSLIIVHLLGHLCSVLRDHCRWAWDTY